jgi:3-oxoacyl-[acyl-carrier protein] reductase
VRLARRLIRQFLIGGSRSATIASNYLVAYWMTKGAIEMLGRTMASILGPRSITVNTVTPGITDTDLVAEDMRRPGVRGTTERMTALGRLSEPDDIAAVVAFLASDDGGWITGALIDASGGMWLGPRI